MGEGHGLWFIGDYLLLFGLFDKRLKSSVGCFGVADVLFFLCSLGFLESSSSVGLWSLAATVLLNCLCSKFVQGQLLGRPCWSRPCFSPFEKFSRRSRGWACLVLEF